jgi:hypothetical protein
LGERWREKIVEKEGVSEKNCFRERRGEKDRKIG